MVLWLSHESDLLTRPARLLHLAPEPAVWGVLSKAPHLDYVTADIEPGALVSVQADARELPFEDGSFDAIVCSHVLEHVVEDVRVAGEFARVLKTGGVALVQVPVDPSIQVTYEDHTVVTPGARATEYGQHDHVRVYAPDVLGRLEGQFASVDRVDYARAYELPKARRMGLIEPAARDGETIYVCRT